MFASRTPSRGGSRRRCSTPSSTERSRSWRVRAASGRLTRHLVDAGHRVTATDASPAMLELARQMVPEAEGIHRLTLPDDPLPPVDAVVSVGHAPN
ncbi:MAG TPA: class I SAM-dependent methyltransferase [Nitriliruptorales bacterium]|nr:class I SAM-dependent methyltransferase [Nitriliruptorales bacterium]